MNTIKLTVIFEQPFWIGVFEIINDGQYKVTKITFGSEPKDYEVFNFIQKNFYKLNFSDPTKVTKNTIKKINPKRLQRNITKQLNKKSVGTKAQNALKKQHEQTKLINKHNKKLQNKQLKEQKYYLRKEKKKLKKKGH